MPAVEAMTFETAPDVTARPKVYFLRTDTAKAADSHDVLTKSHVAASLAALLNGEFAGLLEVQDLPRVRASAQPGAATPHYLIPNETITSLAEAQRLGIRSGEDLFGGVVPYPFVATKLISHPLVPGATAAPLGWNRACAERSYEAVLPGYSVFSHDDARKAAELLLPHGPVRLKDPGGVGGGGQWVAKDREDFETRLATVGAEELATHGLVLEVDLVDPETFSVGQVEIGTLRAAYIGVQTLTRNHHGHDVYGGSSLLVVRGTMEHLLQLPDLAPEMRNAVRQTLIYHHAALDSFPGMFASRCNYDVIQGRDARGKAHSGVLEQSWRIGGASGAEAAALHAFRADPALNCVRAATVEVYGEVELPPGAEVTYSGTDAQAGRLTKYVQVSAHVHA